VTRRALLLIQPFANNCIARTWRQARSTGSNINIPGANLIFRNWLPKAYWAGYSIAISAANDYTDRDKNNAQFDELFSDH
jgi:hypothetical protein